MTANTPREVSANDARIFMRQVLDDARHGRQTSVTRSGRLGGWFIPVVCGRCDVVIRSWPANRWEDLHGEFVCPDGAPHEPAATPRLPRPEGSDPR